MEVLVAFLAFAVMGLVAFMAWLIGNDMGVRPLTKLRPGTYEVRAVVYAGEKKTCLVVRRSYTDHYGEFRMVDLPNERIVGQPYPGDFLVAAPPPWGSTIFYEVRAR